MSFDPGNNAFSGSSAVAVQPNGKILVGGQGRIPLVRLESNGDLDTSFAAAYTSTVTSTVQVITVLTDGKILAGGAYATGPDNYVGVVRFEAGGAIDASFALQPSIDENGNAEVRSMDLATNGKIVATGDFYKIGALTTVNKHIVRLNSNGTIDTDFTGSIEGTGVAHTIAQQSDGKVVVGGSFQTVNGVRHRNIVRFNTDGSVDSAFNAGVDHEVLSLAIQPDGRIFIGGRFTSVNGSRRPAAARLNLDGTLDPTFDPTGIDSGIVRSIVIQPDGKIMFCGLIFTPLSPTFRTGILRINSNGTTDTSFSIDAASDYVNSVSLLADGRIYVGGSFTNLAGSGRNRVARLNSNGTVDSSFISGIGPNAEVRTISQQPDGKLLIGGDFTNVQGVSANRIARLNADGTVDPTFNTGLGFSATVLDIQIQPDGQGSFSILVGGFFTRYNGTNRTGFARLGANGSLSSFAENIAYVYKMAIQTDGKILVGGEFTNAGGQPHKAIVRLNVSADDPCFATPITFGQTFSGTFSSGSCVVNNDRVDIYSFSAVTGQQIALTIYSGNTAVGVKLLSPQGPIIAGDFNPSGAESIRIPGAGYFTLPASGTYLVHAISRSASNTGDYTLSLYRAPETTVCTYSLSPREINAPSTGGSFFFDVLTQPGCPPPTQPAASGTVYNGLSYIG